MFVGGLLGCRFAFQQLGDIIEVILIGIHG